MPPEASRAFGAAGGQRRPPLRKVGNAPNFIRQIFNGRKRSDPYHSSCAQGTRFYGRPLGRSDYRPGNDNTHNVTKCLFARKRYFRVYRLFFAYFFLARQKKVCPRSDSCGCAMITALRCNRRSAPRLWRGRADRGVRPYEMHTESMPPEVQLRCRRKNGTSGASGEKRPAPFCRGVSP